MGLPLPRISAGTTNALQIKLDSGQCALCRARHKAHARRGIYEVWIAQKSPIAQAILERIKALYAIEDAVRGQPAPQRLAARQAHSIPKLTELKRYLETALSSLSRKCALAKAIRYCLVRWPALTRYTSDGRLEIDNSAAERALRTVPTERSLCTSYSSV